MEDNLVKINRDNNIAFIEIDSENKVVRHDYHYKEAPEGWLKITHDYSFNILTAGRNRTLYDPATNSVKEVASSHFQSEREVQDRFTKEAGVKAVRVTTTTGKTFDGDEKSQDRMMRAIQIASITDETTTNWKLADNTIVEVTLDELREALALAGKEMSRLWLT